MGGALDKVTDVIGDVTGAVMDILGVTPETPQAPEGPTEIETGQIASNGATKTFSEEEEASRRKAVRKKRLGTKKLQIPLEKTGTSGLAAPTSTGIKV
jgi:hypothetical protein